MSSLTQETILDCLKTVKYPGFSRDIVSFGIVKGVGIENGRVGIRLSVTTADKNIPVQLRESITATLKEMTGVTGVDVVVDVSAPLQAAMQAEAARPSTPSPALSTSSPSPAAKAASANRPSRPISPSPSRQTNGAAVGLCDCDIYGPSIGLMFGTQRTSLRHRGQSHPAHRTLWPQTHEHGLPARRHRARHPARPHGHPLHATIPPAVSSGANSTTSSSISRPAPATSSSPSSRPSRSPAPSSSPPRRKSPSSTPAKPPTMFEKVNVPSSASSRT